MNPTHHFYSIMIPNTPYVIFFYFTLSGFQGVPKI